MSATAIPESSRQDVHSQQRGFVDRLIAPLFRPIDIGLVAFFRIAFGLLMLVEIGRYVYHDWIDQLYIAPKFHFSFYGFSWVQPWPGNGMYWHFAALTVLAVMITLGLFYRVAAALFFVGITYVFLLDQALYLNHIYLICLISFLAIFLPANRKWSLDARRRPEIRSDTTPAWTLWILRFQVGAAYFFGGIAKLDADWFNGSAMGLMLQGKSNFPVIGPYLGETWMIMFFVWGGLLFDLLIVPALLWDRTRVPAYIACIFFHSTNARLFHIGIFPLFMIAATMLFFPADSLKSNDEEKKGKRKKDHKRRTSTELEVEPTPLTTHQRWIAAALGLYVLVQVLMPFRHFLYPGPVNWTEEGHRFAWHMKLRVKRTEANFRAVDADGRPVDLSRFENVLTLKQRGTMAGRPDMVLQYAKYLAAQLRADGVKDPKIYVDSLVSLNGRPARPLIDPNVNLAEEPRTLRHVDWLLPLED